MVGTVASIYGSPVTNTLLMLFPIITEAVFVYLKLAGLYQLLQQLILSHVSRQAVWPNSLAFTLPPTNQADQQELPQPELPQGILSQTSTMSFYLHMLVIFNLKFLQILGHICSCLYKL